MCLSASAFPVTKMFFQFGETSALRGGFHIPSSSNMKINYGLRETNFLSQMTTIVLFRLV